MSPVAKKAATKEAKPTDTTSTDVTTTILSLLEGLNVAQLLDLEEQVRDKFKLDNLDLGSLSSSSQSAGNEAVAKTWSLKLVSLGTVSRVNFIKESSSALGVDLITAKGITDKMPYLLVDKGTQEEVDQKKSLLDSVCPGLEFDVFEE